MIQEWEIEVSWYVVAILVALIVGQLAKYSVVSFRSRTAKNFTPLYISGGMPSVHSAVVMSLLVTIGALEGLESVSFAIALLFAMIVMYDSMTVRRSSGEQGDALRSLLMKGRKPATLLYVAKGHTAAEVAVGALLGSVIGFIVSVIAFQ